MTRISYISRSAVQMPWIIIWWSITTSANLYAWSSLDTTPLQILQMNKSLMLWMLPTMDMKWSQILPSLWLSLARRCHPTHTSWSSSSIWSSLTLLPIAILPWALWQVDTWAQINPRHLALIVSIMFSHVYTLLAHYLTGSCVHKEIFMFQCLLEP